MAYIAYCEADNTARVLRGNSKARREVEVENFAEHYIDHGRNEIQQIEIVVFDTDDAPGEVFTYATTATVAKVS